MDRPMITETLDETTGQLVSRVDTDPNGNESTIRAQAAQALATNRAFLAIATPTNAQTLAQVKALTRQTNGIIRLLLGALDGTD